MLQYSQFVHQTATVRVIQSAALKGGNQPRMVLRIRCLEDRTRIAKQLVEGTAEAVKTVHVSRHPNSILDTASLRPTPDVIDASC